MKIDRKLELNQTAQLFLLIIAIIPFILLSYFNHPTDDDFHNAFSFRENGFVDGCVWLYHNWTGRYTSILLYGVFFDVQSFDKLLINTKVAPVLFIALLILSAWFLFSSFNKKNSWAVNVINAFYFTILYLCSIPLVSSAIYWYTGAEVYTSGVILFISLLACLFRFTGLYKQKARLIWASAIIVNLILLIGCCEQFLLFTILLFCFMLLTSEREHRAYFIVFFLLSVTAGAMSLAAPGNIVRAQTEMPNGIPLGALSLVSTGVKTIFLTTQHVVQWASNPVLWLFSILFILNNKNILLTSYSTKKFYIMGFFFFVTIYLVAFPSILHANDEPPRVWNAIYIVFLFSWCCFTYALLNSYPQFLLKITEYVNVNLIICVTFCILYLSNSSKVSRAFIDIAFKSKEYNSSQLLRYSSIKEGIRRGDKQLVVEPLLSNDYQYPQTIFLHELDVNPNNIANTGMAKYFGLDSIKLRHLTNNAPLHLHEQ